MSSWTIRFLRDTPSRLHTIPPQAKGRLFYENMPGVDPMITIVKISGPKAGDGEPSAYIQWSQSLSRDQWPDIWTGSRTVAFDPSWALAPPTCGHLGLQSSTAIDSMYLVYRSETAFFEEHDAQNRKFKGRKLKNAALNPQPPLPSSYSPRFCLTLKDLLTGTKVG
ncbi:uncharacterized protein ATNIH1004_004224 [Aspergillus tanneri]|uniref:Uncharacterized protein n=1 Tax=Aspergillus tanneri TaxID=1220188 RepID=A0A5M9MUN8_9EURO|nr:uncharacterized protein ATNIH1004_004224 [Aspergillus tanneri]KAA8648339.1 hypothetical protein ATNIH1004_004224 [Aspergillus tanneri]